ncbi:MAG: hypothetical protein KJ749_04885 [Planctomycetes bacterium]|nr:hypothetical protein [Planctomycetota bacterium]
MPYVSWKESYSIGIPEADADHQYLFELINGLHEADDRMAGQIPLQPPSTSLKR